MSPTQCLPFSSILNELTHLPSDKMTIKLFGVGTAFGKCKKYHVPFFQRMCYNASKLEFEFM